MNYGSIFFSFRTQSRKWFQMSLILDYNLLLQHFEEVDRECSWRVKCNEHVFDEPFKSSHEWTCWRNNEYFAYKNIPHVLLNWPLQHFYKGEKMEAMKKRYFATKPLAYRKNDGFLRPTNWIVSQQIFPCTQSPLDCWLFSMLWINSVCNQLMNHHLGR